jgi:hypothetical protein
MHVTNMISSALPKRVLSSLDVGFLLGLVYSFPLLKELKNLKNRIVKEGLICSQTDKTGRLTLDTLENMTEKMEKHVENDKVIIEKEVKTLENRLNNHMDCWIKILQPGKNNNQTKRVKNNLVTKDNQIP